MEADKVSGALRLQSSHATMLELPVEFIIKSASEFYVLVAVFTAVFDMLIM